MNTFSQMVVPPIVMFVLAVIYITFIFLFPETFNLKKVKFKLEKVTIQHQHTTSAIRSYDVIFFHEL